MTEVRRSEWQPENPGPPVDKDSVLGWLDAVGFTETDGFDEPLARLIVDFTSDVCLDFSEHHGGICLRYRGCSEEPIHQVLGPDEILDYLAFANGEPGLVEDDARRALIATRDALARLLAAFDSTLATLAEAPGDLGDPS